MAEDAKIIIDVDVETKKVENELDKVLNEYSNKKIELDLQLKDQSYLRRQLKALDDQIKSIDGNPPTNLTSAFNKLKEEFSQSIIKTTELKNQLNLLSKEYRTLYSELQKVSNASPLDNIKNSFSNFGKILSNISSSVSNTFGRITSLFKNFNFHAINSSRHVDYFGRRIFNLLRNAFVFNIISRQFRGLSALLGNLVHRDIYFAKSLMIVKANLVRAFAPIWQVILPWIRALGDGLVWISNQLIRFINFLTGSKIKPLQGFQEAKQVVDDFKRIASPTKDLFDLKDPNKYAKQLRDNIKSSQQPSNKVSKNVDRLSRKLKDSQKQTTKLLAKFDKLEVLKFKKTKDPLGLSELSDPKKLDKNKGIDIPINIPSVEDQISDAINNIQDKPLDFYVNDNLGEQITSQVNGLTLPALDFKVDENSENALNNFKEKMVNLWLNTSNIFENIKNKFNEIINSDNPLKRIFSDQEVQVEFKNNFDSMINNIKTSFMTLYKFGYTIGSLIFGGISDFLSKSEGRIKEQIIRYLKLDTEGLDFSSKFFSSFSNVFEVFGGPEAQSILGNNLSACETLISSFALNVYSILLSLAESLFSPFVNHQDDIKQAFQGILDAFEPISNGVKTLAENISDSLDSLTENSIKPVIKVIGDVWNDFVGIIVGAWNKYVSPKLKEIGEKFDEIMNSKVGEAIKSAVSAINKLWQTISLVISKIWEFLKPFVNWMIEGFIDKLSEYFKNISKTIMDVINDISGVIGNLWKMLEGLIDFITGIFTGDWKRAWNGASKIVDGAVGVMKEALNILLSLINGLTSTLIGAMNAAIRSINRISFDLPGFLGGAHIGFNIPEIPENFGKIPKLAQGSVLKGGDPFLAYLNDQPRGQTNVEAPLSTIVDAFKQAINESNYNNQPDITINASGDMSSFIRMLNFKLQDENNRLGGSFVDTSSF